MLPQFLFGDQAIALKSFQKIVHQALTIKSRLGDQKRGYHLKQICSVLVISEGSA
jgi:hypothetical protein